MLGTGTKQDPYLVSTEQDLNDIRNDIDACYKLTNDIYMTEEWTPIPVFSGSIDGDGYTIHDLYINQPSESNIGLIGYLDYSGLDISAPFDMAVINLNLKDVNIVGGGSTGAIAGRVRGIENVFVDYFENNYSSVTPVEITNCTVEGVIRSSSNGVGGLVGSTHSIPMPTAWDSQSMINLIVTDSHVDVEIFAFGSSIGGIVGDATSGGITIRTSSTRGSIHNANERVGGMVGYGGGGRTGGSDSYSLMNLQGSNYVGGMVGRTNSHHEYWVGGGISGYFAGTFNVSNSSGITIGVNVAHKDRIVNGGEPTSDFLYDSTKANFKDLNRVNIKDGIGKTTAEMKDIKTYIEHGFSFPSVWYTNKDTEGDYLRLRSEFDQSIFELEGEGTVENPYLISSVEHLVNLHIYDGRNWSEYNRQIQDEVTFGSENYKEGYNISPPNRYHYKLTNDINLGEYPFTHIGWKPLSNTLDNKPNRLPYYNSIGERIGSTTDFGETYTSTHYADGLRNIYRRRGFMGVFDGSGYRIKNLKLTDDWTIDSRDSNDDSGSSTIQSRKPRVGFFGVITGGTVKNVTFEDVDIQSHDYGGYRVDRPTSEEATTLYATVAGVTNSHLIKKNISERTDIDRIIINGESHLTDYRDDVGGARGKIAGLINRIEGTTLVTNIGVKINHHVYNVHSNDPHYMYFTPTTFYLSSNSIISTSYSASSTKAYNTNNQLLSGIHGNIVFVGGGYWITDKVDGTVIDCYYDSEVANAIPSDTERGLDIHGRSTEAMYLVSTYQGWDFTTTWQTDGTSYPTIQPYDPNYVPPVNNTTYTVSFYLDELYMMADSEGEHKVLRTVVLNGKAKRFTGKTTAIKRGTAHMNTELEPLYAVAFEYVEPVIGDRTVITEVIELNMHASATKSSSKENIVTTVLDEVSTSVESEGINRGAFFNAIEVITIRTNSVLIRLNDRRVSSVDMIYGENQVAPFSRQQDSSYIVIPFEPSLFNEGENSVELRGISDDNETLVTKILNINKTYPEYRNQTGRYVIINDEHYIIQAHEADGTITLDRELPSDMIRQNGDGTFRTFELTEYTHTPKLSIGSRGHEPNFKDGELIRVKNVGNLIEEEYEFTGDGEEIITKVEFERQQQDFAITGDAKDSDYYRIYTGLNNESGVYRYSHSDLSKMFVRDGEEFEITNDTFQGKIGDTAFMKINIRIGDLVRDRIDNTYRSGGISNFRFRWDGNSYYGSGGSWSKDRRANATFYIMQGSSYVELNDSIIENGSVSMFSTLIEDPTNYIQGDGTILIMVRTQPSREGNNWAEWNKLGTDYFNFGFDVSNTSIEVPLISEVRQSFTPKYNNNKTI